MGHWGLVCQYLAKEEDGVAVDQSGGGQGVSRPLVQIDCRRKAFSPAGIIVKEVGRPLSPARELLDFSHEHRRGS